MDRVAAGAWHYVGNSGFQRGSAYVFASSDIRRRNTEVTWQAAIWFTESKTDLTNNYFYGCDEDVSPSECALSTRTVSMNMKRKQWHAATGRYRMGC